MFKTKNTDATSFKPSQYFGIVYPEPKVEFGLITMNYLALYGGAAS